MKPPRHRPDQFGQPRLGRHVNVFKRNIIGKRGRKFGSDLIKPVCNHARILSAQNSRRAEHRNMRL